MGRSGIPIGRFLGIEIGLDYTWFAIFAVLTWMLGSSYFPAEFKGWPAWQYWLTGAATAFLLFASVLLHELGHSVVALRFGVPVRRITLYLFGGVAQIETEPPSPRAEFFIAIAGPVVSLALALFFRVLQPLAGGFEPLLGLTRYLAYINAALALFNLAPGYPLDGGRVFRAIVWATTGDMRRATRVAANAGRFLALLLIFVGVMQMFGGNLSGGLWIAFIGWFLDMAASAQLQQMTFQGLLAGHTVAQAMNIDNALLPEEITLQALVDEHIFRGGQRCFLIGRQDEPVGLMTLQRIKEVPREEWPFTPVGRVMLPLEDTIRVESDSELWGALQKMDRAGVNQLPVTRGDRVVGMLSRQDIISFLRALEELSARPLWRKGG